MEIGDETWEVKVQVFWLGRLGSVWTPSTWLRKFAGVRSWARVLLQISRLQLSDVNTVANWAWVGNANPPDPEEIRAGETPSSNPKQ